MTSSISSCFINQPWTPSSVVEQNIRRSLKAGFLGQVDSEGWLVLEDLAAVPANLVRGSGVATNLKKQNNKINYKLKIFDFFGQITEMRIELDPLRKMFKKLLDNKSIK